MLLMWRTLETMLVAVSLILNLLELRLLMLILLIRILLMLITRVELVGLLQIQL